MKDSIRLTNSQAGLAAVDIAAMGMGPAFGEFGTAALKYLSGLATSGRIQADQIIETACLILSAIELDALADAELVGENPLCETSNISWDESSSRDRYVSLEQVEDDSGDYILTADTATDKPSKFFSQHFACVREHLPHLCLVRPVVPDPTVVPEATAIS